MTHILSIAVVCIPKYKRCDGSYDCVDESDEEYCCKEYTVFCIVYVCTYVCVYVCMYSIMCISGRCLNLTSAFHA